MPNITQAEDAASMEYTEADAIQALKTELEKGIESMKQETSYTIEAAWKEIDAI